MNNTTSDSEGARGDRNAPAISVVMPSRNVARFIDEAISSILHQTFTDFELIICDDASNDGTPEKIAEWAAKDTRIRAFYSDENLGPAKVANWTISLARSPLIVRMDADDISEPSRLSQQYDVMRAHPDIVVFGSMFVGIDENSRQIYGVDRTPLLRSTFTMPCGHAMSIMRTEAIRSVGGYREVCNFWEDFDLIYRLAGIGRVCFGTIPLYRYRHSRAHARVNADLLRIEQALELRIRCNRQFLLTEEYDSVLEIADTTAESQISPQVHLAIASLHVLAGNRHNLLRRFFTRARIHPDFQSLFALGKLLITRIAPKLVRTMIARRRRTRDKIAMKQLGSQTIIEWHWSQNHPQKRLEETLPAQARG